MITYAQWTARFPEFVTVPEARFDIFLGDAVIEMGTNEARWLNLYDLALANLVGHLYYIGSRSAAGAQGAVVPVRSKEVDEVVVEYALSREQQNSFDALNATVYGQTYLKHRRTCFAGGWVA